MPVIQELSRRQIDECVGEMIRREAPLSVSCRVGDAWFSLHTRLIQRTDLKLWLTYPVIDQGVVPKLNVGLPVSLSFKVKHHKHVFAATIEAISELAVGGVPVQAVCVAYPWRMQRIQRRAFNRVDIPRSRSVLATFWQGGLAGCPTDQSELALTWEGWLINLSAGGFQARASRHSLPEMEDGDLAGIRIDVGQEYEPILADAQLRHQEDDGQGGVLLGFQFVGLNDSAQGREMIRRLGQIVLDFQRQNNRRRADTA